MPEPTGQPRRYAVLGNCQAQELSKLLEHIFRDDEERSFSFFPTYDLTPEGRRSLAAGISSADCVVSQAQLFRDQDLNEAISGHANVIHFPAVTLTCLWPNSGGRHPRASPPDAWTGQPFYGGLGDLHINRCLEEGQDPKQIEEGYATGRLADMVPLERLLKADEQRIRKVTAGFDLDVWGLVERFFAGERVFWTFKHASWTLLGPIFRVVCEQIGGVSHSELDRADKFFRDRDVLSERRTPVHPDVAATFGLRWAEPSYLGFSFLDGWFDFAEFVRRYALFQYDEATREAQSLVAKGKFRKALAQLDPTGRTGLEEPFLLTRAGVLVRLGRRSKARADIERLIESVPFSFGALLSCIDLANALGEDDLADRAISVAMSIDPTNWRLKKHLATAALRRGDRPAARAYAAEYVQVDPDAEPRFRALAAS